MTPPSLEQYLTDARAGVKSGIIDLLVLGNEAADLDSMVSALAVARSASAGHPERSVVPLIPVPRKDFRLRTEAVYLFGRAGIDPARLIFLDDLDFATLAEQVGCLALVDHNRLAAPFSAWGEKVDIIIDHHPDQGLYPQARTRTVEPVGSCATLAAEMLLREAPGCLDSRMAVLLAGTILLDTVNLDPGAGRVTDKDRKMAHRLIAARPGLDQPALYNALSRAKFDTSALNSQDLLRRDVKTLSAGGLRWEIASMPLSVAAWQRRDPDFYLAVQRRAAAGRLDILISMHAYTDRTFRRDLGIFCPDPYLHDRLARFLTARPLGLTPLLAERHRPLKRGRLSFYSQADITVSRKRLIPVLNLFAADLTAAGPS